MSLPASLVQPSRESRLPRPRASSSPLSRALSTLWRPRASCGPLSCVQASLWRSRTSRCPTLTPPYHQPVFPPNQSLMSCMLSPPRTRLTRPKNWPKCSPVLIPRPPPFTSPTKPDHRPAPLRTCCPRNDRSPASPSLSKGTSKNPSFSKMVWYYANPRRTVSLNDPVVL